MTTDTNSRRRVNPAHAILIVGFLAILIAVMFRPAGAVADLPSRVTVFDKHSASKGVTKDVGSFSQVTRDYKVIPTKKSSAVTSSLTGVPLVEFLKAVDANLENVAFARVRLNTTDDSRLWLAPLGESGAERPPLLLASGKVASRSLGTPSLVPGQPELDKPIRQESIVGFSKSKPYIEIIPARPGAKIFRVEIHKRRLKSGQYLVWTEFPDGSGAGPTEYQWFQTDAKGNQTKLGSTPKVTTTATGTKDVVVNVVVTKTDTGSTGIQYTSYIPKSSEEGSTKSPGGGSGSGSGGGNTTGSGTGTGVPGGTGTITATPQPYVPPTTTTQPSTPTTPPPTTTTPPPTTTQSPSIDTTVITNTAQNVEGTGGLRVVSGVLLAPPTAAAAAGGGGSPLSVLPAPVASELNSIFQPVESADQAWAYLLAILFAFSFSGAVREWVKP